MLLEVQKIQINVEIISGTNLVQLNLKHVNVK